MLNSKKILSLLFTSSLFILIGCSSREVPKRDGGFTYSSIYFGKVLNQNFKQGIIDGCTTAKGRYQKVHRLFNSNDEYNKGWFLGRNRCRNLLKIDENGDLIL